MPLMKEMFDFKPVSSWVENFNESTHDSSSRTRIFENFVMLPEVEESARIILDRINRKQGRGFFITGLYGSGKTIFMAWLSAILTEQTLRKQFLDNKPEWGLDALVTRKLLTINFTAIEVPDETLEQAFWNSVTDHLRHLSPPVTAMLSNTDAYLDTFFNHTASGTRSDVESWIHDNRNLTIDQLRAYDKEYQKTIIEQAVFALNIQLVQDRTTVTEKVKKLVEIARERGYEGVLVFIDELYLHLIQSDEQFNRGTAFLGQLAEAGLAGDQSFWIFGAVQEEIQAIARQAGRKYDAELMGKLSGQSGRFQSINIPVTQFHRIYNHRLFRENSKCVHKLADLFRAELQPHYRGAFTDFMKRYFREREPITDEAKHFADVYPMHPFGLYCLTAITNRGGRSRGALGFVQEFIEKRLQNTTDWKRVAVLDDVFDYEDLRNKIIQDDPEMAKYYGMFERFCSTARDEVLARAPYRKWPEKDLGFTKNTIERIIKALIILSMVKEELSVSKLNDALLLRWPGKESDPAGSDQETARILEKIAQTFPPLRQKGSGENLSFFLSVEGDGGEREELLAEVARIENGFAPDIQTESAYRSHIELFLRFPGSPLGGTVPPQHGFSTQVDVDWQRTRRFVDYRLERVTTLINDHAVIGFIKDVPATKALHIVVLHPSASPLDVEMDAVRHGNGRTLIWLPATLPAQDVNEIKRSMALVKLFGDYQSQVNAGGASQLVRRKLELLGEWIDLPAGTKSAQPARKAIEILLESFVNGEIRQWNPKDQAWEILCEPAELLSLYQSIPQSERSLERLLEKFSSKALSKVFHFHPNFHEAYSFSADFSPAIRRRVLEAIWKGRITDSDGTAKADLEKHLAPLGLLNTGVSGEVSVTLATNSIEAFRKAKERIRDNIRKANPTAISISETRKRVKTTDLGLTDTWFDILITLLISIGEISGYTIHGMSVSQDDRTIGSPVDWLQELDELRPGTRPDEILWHDLTESLHALGLWKEGTGYSPAAADRLLDLLKEIETRAKEEFRQAELSLETWPGTSIPQHISEWVDIFSLPEDARESRITCYSSVRDAMRDLLSLSDDEDIEAANRYTCVEEFAHRVRGARDFLDRVAELASLTGKLHELKALDLPFVIEKPCQDLLDSIETYVKSAGSSGEMSRITAEWKDLHEHYLNQYLSEHAGLHNDLKLLRDSVLTSSNYQILKNLSFVEGLSAHFNPGFIESELTGLLTQVDVQQVCEQKLDDVKTDLSNGWVCSACGYKPSKRLEIKPDHILELVQRGIKEFLDHVRGCEAELRDYVSDTPAANPLIGLLNDPADSSALEALQDAAMRGHLADALAEADALKVNVDELLEQLKPRLVGFFKGGRCEFEQYIQDNLAKLLKKINSTEEDKPWKVE
ncbi:DUF2570 domain-containing protein [Paenibacillus alginolyticus]|uniref:hypothetical protein n=1 Tax=Paenibacillus alginolyticus TaxID=59839 RepID=UPI0004041ADA|nr:hypothetical protein [Paenibacillus alginolyticus]MCY9666475.1 DUF2570 domain-containing protein [Paenibacillus alginolyticus]